MRDFFWAAYAVTWRQTKVSFRNPAILLPSMMFPFFFFTAFSGGLARVGNLPSFHYEPGYTTFVFGFVIFQAAGFGSVNAGLSIAADFESKFSRRLLLAARYRSSILLGYIGAAIIRISLTLVLMTMVGLLAGIRIHANIPQLIIWVSLLWMMISIATAWTAGMAMRLRTVQGGPAFQVPILLAFFLSPAFMPRELLSGWVHHAADFNPITAFVEASRSLLAGQPEQIGVTYLVALMMIIIFWTWGITGLRQAEKNP